MTIKWCIIHEIWSATEFLIIFGHFLPFYPPNSLQNENTKKMKKCLEISSFYTSVPKIMIVGYTVPEISHKAERIIFHFGQFFALLRLKNEKNTWRYHHFTQCTINDSHMIYGFWDMKCNRQNFFVILGHFFTLLLSQQPKKWTFQKNEKKPGDIIIQHKCTKNHNLMLYFSWDMVRDKCNYFSFWAIFRPFTPPTAQKIKISKKWKKHLEISPFYTYLPIN